MLGRLAIAAFIANAWAAALAAEPPASLALTERAMVAAIADGATFSLTDGRTVRLAALDVPRRSDRGDRPGAIATAARDALESLLAGGEVGLAPAAAATDRYDRTLAHVVNAQGRWVQAEMLARGLARVAAFADDTVGLQPLLEIEDEARQARRGLWALREFRVIDAEEAIRHLDSFQLIEGRVLAVERKAGRTFLNFGADWRSDFTVSIEAKLRRQMAGRGLDPESYQGKMVRVRGWIRSRNGPLIELARPEQIEVIAR
ncbi:MAG TPA: thermonuclease family protein [Alphaproteobacteria bacterium]|nr:thermonuclease family protein [Alphaproteobacteria bacterium]